jgi:CBS domain-containing membrane protein
MPTLADLTLREVPVVEPQTTLDEVHRLLNDEPLKTVVLVGDEMFFGVFNEDTLNSGLVPPGADPTTLQVGPYIHPTRALGNPTMPVADALALLQRRGLNVLPVVQNRTYLGVVTRADLEAVSA